MNAVWNIALSGCAALVIAALMFALFIPRAIRTGFPPVCVAITIVTANYMLLLGDFSRGWLALLVVVLLIGVYFVDRHCYGRDG